MFRDKKLRAGKLLRNTDKLAGWRQEGGRKGQWGKTEQGTWL